VQTVQGIVDLVSGDSVVWNDTTSMRSSPREVAREDPMAVVDDMVVCTA
jgi:hypothetical protein